MQEGDPLDEAAKGEGDDDAASSTSSVLGFAAPTRRVKAKGQLSGSQPSKTQPDGNKNNPDATPNAKTQKGRPSSPLSGRKDKSVDKNNASLQDKSKKADASLEIVRKAI